MFKILKKCYKIIIVLNVYLKENVFITHFLNRK